VRLILDALQRRRVTGMCTGPVLVQYDLLAGVQAVNRCVGCSAVPGTIQFILENASVRRADGEMVARRHLKLLAGDRLRVGRGGAGVEIVREGVQLAGCV